MSTYDIHLQMDATVPIPGYGIKLFGMMISVPPPRPSSNAALPVPGVADHHAVQISGCVTKSGNGKEPPMELQQQALKYGAFGFASDEIAASSSSTSTLSFTETLREAATSMKSASSTATGHRRRITINEHFHSAEKESEDDLKRDVSENEDRKKINDFLPCPRCDSRQTKFCYFNNYSVNQPRHFCKRCHRYWTAGGMLRSVPMGAGRRKRKQPSFHTIDAAHVDRVIARENATDATQQSLLYSFGRPCSIDGSISSPGLSLLPEALPELELSLAGKCDISDHFSLGQMHKAVSDCDECLCRDKTKPVNFAIGSDMNSERGSLRSGPGSPFHIESFNNALGGAARAAMLASAGHVATNSHFCLGKHPRDTNYRGDPEICELASSRHGRTQYTAKTFSGMEASQC
ncbi:hypothetical protein O6H91_20G073300 [Diphasiastrum complanatum]|uniref:Uncharacterized protein n=1 Tax=Diphasiastrum complanatum TaxID=34168 RepID=A0ACC2ARW2_DIPCM|nr:hypothetical protein O6H91_20G073300 [Diphasiastrum complanatum]